MLWCMRRTNIYLTDEQCDALDVIAAREATSRAVVVRRLIDNGLLAAEPSPEESVAAIDASFGIATDLQPVARGRDARSEHLAKIGRSGT